MSLSAGRLHHKEAEFCIHGIERKRYKHQFSHLVFLMAAVVKFELLTTANIIREHIKI